MPINKIFVFISSFFLFFIVTPGSVLAADFQGVYNAILSPQQVTDINNQLIVGTQTPKDKIYMIIRYMGSDAVANPITFDLGKYTGLTITDSPASWQRGRYDAGSLENVSSGFQLAGTSGGIYIDTAKFDYQPVIGGGPQAAYAYEWSIDKTSKPWKNLDSDLVLQVNARLPYMERIPDTTGYVPNAQYNFWFYLWDVSNPALPKALCFVISFFEPRGVQPEAVLTDPSDGSKFVTTSLHAGARYVTVSPYSSILKSTPWSELTFFRVHITRRNLINVIQDYNNTLLSLNPSDYILQAAGLSVETTNDAEAKISIGASFDSFGIFEFARTNCREDVNGDKIVNLADIVRILGKWGQSAAGLPEDINQDGIVNLADLQTILSLWGQACQ